MHVSLSKNNFGCLKSSLSNELVALKRASELEKKKRKKSMAMLKDS